MALRYTAGFDTVASDNTVINYELEIDDVNYVGDPTDLIMGGNPIECEYTNADSSKLAPLRQSSLSFELIATEAFELNNLYTDDERTYKVTLKKDGSIFGHYFIIPDGTREWFMDPPYTVNVRAIDGLGLLDNFKYVSDTGAFYSGPDSIINIFAKCLSVLGLDMPINTFSKISYDGMDINDDAFAKVKIYQDRYLIQGKNVQDVMSCGEIMESILKEWVASIVQMNGEWFIFRWNDIATNFGDVVFRKYDSNGVFIGDNIINIDLILGNKSGDVWHVNADQMRSVDMPYKQVAIKYTYGFLRNLLSESASFFQGDISGNFFDWDKQGTLSADPSLAIGFPASLYGHFNASGDGDTLSLTNKITLQGGLHIKIELTFNVGHANAQPIMVSVFDGTNFQFLGPNGWQPTEVFFTFSNFQRVGNNTFGLGQTITGVWEFDLPPVEATYEFDVYIGKAYYYADNIYGSESGESKLYDIRIGASAGSIEFVSETWTTTNNANYSTVPDVIEVFNGEGDYEAFWGTMLKEDLTHTDGFIRYGAAEILPFLEIASQDILYQHGRPMNKYEGSIYGIFPYLSRINISNGLSGVFMPMTLRYDFRANIVQSTLIEVSAAEVPSDTIQTFEYVERKEVEAGGQ